MAPNEAAAQVDAADQHRGFVESHVEWGEALRTRLLSLTVSPSARARPACDRVPGGAVQVLHAHSELRAASSRAYHSTFSGERGEWSAS